LTSNKEKSKTQINSDKLAERMMEYIQNPPYSPFAKGDKPPDKTNVKMGNTGINK
jgi:hypothetical protein